MSDPERNTHIKKEAEAHLELGSLLKRNRDADSKARVGEILRSERPLPEKIREIRKVDADAEGEIPDSEPDSVAQPLSRGLSVIKPVIKFPHPRLGYLEYYFRHHRRVREFARKTHVLMIWGLFPRPRVDPDVQRAFRQDLQNVAGELLKHCGLALQTGWRELGKEDYNLIAVLEKLCFEISSANFKVLNYRDRDLIDKLRNLETYFFIMHYRPEYTTQVTQALLRALTANLEYKGDREELAVTIAKILSPDLALPSLFNFLIGLNIVKHRCMLTFDDLICRDLGDLINKKDFACPPETQGHINERVKTLRKELYALRRQKTDVEHLRKVLKIDDEGNPDFSPLQSVYDGAPGVSQSFRADQNNLMLFGPRFLKSFDDTFYPLLNGSIRISEIGRVTVFTKDRFPLQCHKLRQVAAALTRLNFSLHVFTRARFLTLKNTGKGAVAAEADCLQQIDEGVQIMLEIATAVEDILDSRLRGSDKPLEAAPDEPLVPKERDFSLPSKEQRIISRSSLNNKPVSEALKFLVTVCYAAGAFFLDRPILLTLERAGRVDDKINDGLTELQRIADPVVFRQEFAEQFHAEVDAAQTRAMSEVLGEGVPAG
jgi:hypothetical protein